ncbi:MAG: hypothetical protein ACLR8Y_22040 [Alistipes indistinctus]
MNILEQIIATKRREITSAQAVKSMAWIEAEASVLTRQAVFVPESPARIPDRHYRRVQTQIAVERLYQTGSRYRRDHRKL